MALTAHGGEHPGHEHSLEGQPRPQRGRAPRNSLEVLGVLDGPTIAAHGVWLDDADMQILKRHGTGIAHCPSSNMKLASGVAPVVKLLSLGIPVGVGTDGPAGSNNDFDLMEEMNLASDLQKVTSGDPTVLNAEQAVAFVEFHANVAD